MALKNVEDIYPLSPMQETMLFHACTGASTSSLNAVSDFSAQDVLFNQACFKITGQLDNSLFQQAWQAILDRHAALRTAFAWKGLKSPQQIVRAKLELPFTSLDISAKPIEEQKKILDKIGADDREKEFQPERAPLMRVTLIKCDDRVHRLIWSSHHLVLDRWCIPFIFNELVTFYKSLVEGHTLSSEKSPSFKNYIAWLAQRDINETRRYWMQQLAGFRQSTGITLRQKVEEFNSDIVREGKREINQPQLESIKTYCKNYRVTTATLIQGAWSLLLHHYTNNQDLMFGVVVSGRPALLDNVEDIIGSFVNNLPVRIKLSDRLTIKEWLQGIQRNAYQRVEFEHISAATLHTWSELPSDQSLFDSILVWLAPAEIKNLEGLQIEPLPADMATAYPFTLTIEERSDSIIISAQLDERFALSDSITSVLLKLSELIVTLAETDSDLYLTDLAAVKTSAQEMDMRTSRANLSEQIFQQSLASPASTDVHFSGGREETKAGWIEDYLRTEWQQILRLDNVGLDEDFFALGGNSIKATQLLTRIEQAERIKIPILSLFQKPTIRSMAKTIIEQNWPLNPETITSINSRGSRTPLFCIASPDVNTLGYANLSNNLDPDIPLYVVQSPPDKDFIGEVKASQILEYANRYIKAIQQIQPSGPYQLLGMCSGAHIAFEIGKQLEAKNESCDFLGVVNTWAYYTISDRFKYKIVENLCHYYIDRIRSLTLKECKRLLKKKIAFLFTNTIEAQATEVQPVNSTDPATPPDLAYSYYDDIDPVHWAHLEPKIEKFYQPVTVFRCKKQPYWRVPMRCLGWSKHASNVDIINIKGKVHLEILRKPYVADISKHLERSLLSNARQGS